MGRPLSSSSPPGRPANQVIGEKGVRRVRIVLGVLSVLVGVAFLAIGGGKLLSTDTFASQIGIPAWLVVVIGVLEIAGAVGVLAGLRFPQLGLAAAAGLVLLLLGAVVHHLLRGDLLQSGLLSVVLLLLSGAVLALRVRTSRAAVPAGRHA